MTKDDILFLILFGPLGIIGFALAIFLVAYLFKLIYDLFYNKEDWI